MCGIVGYIGTRQAPAICLAGLRRLEYRGYDSAGIAVVTDEGRLDLRKVVDARRKQSLESAEAVEQTLPALRPYPVDRIEHGSCPRLATAGTVALDGEAVRLVPNLLDKM